MLCTSGFMDDVIFSYQGVSGPQSSTMLCLEEVCQVMVLAGRQTTTMFVGVHQNVAPGAKCAIYD